MPETREIEIESWDRFETPNLAIEYALVGYSHEFRYMDAMVTISLPGHEHIDNRSETARIREWRIIDGQQVPQKVVVHLVDVCVKQGRRITLPAEVLTRPPKAVDVIPADDQAKLNAYTKDANRIARNAFDYWLSIVRWKSGKYLIGIPDIPNITSDQSTYLRESASLARVWIAPGYIVVPRCDVVTKDEWASAGAAVEVSQEVPIHFKFFAHAHESFLHQEYRRTIIDLAITCEIFMRTPVLSQLPLDLDPDIRVMVEEANINQYVRKFFPNILCEEGQRKFKSLANDHLGSLFDARNKIMHMAKEERATRENCLRFIKATETLFEVGAMTT